MYGIKMILILKMLKTKKQKQPTKTMSTEEKKRCSGCTTQKSLEKFIGKLGQPVKTCLECRKKDAIRSKRPDVQEKARVRNSEKQYSQKHRAKQKEADPVAYNKKNAGNAKRYRDNNPEKIADYRKKHFPSRLGSIKSQAQKKGIVWDNNMTDELCYKMMISNCYYCGFLSDETLNGIDRMDSMDSYKESNCVGCCGKCNFMKGSLDPSTFVDRCKHISKHFGGKGEYNHAAWSDSYSSSLNEYKKRAVNMGLEFNLTQDQFNHLVNSNCFYCDKVRTKSHRNGIDRKDNNIGYILENCVACCGQCNQMKCQLTDVDYIECCKRTSEYCIANDIKFDESIPKCVKRITKRVKQDVPKGKIEIAKQQPKKERPMREQVEEYIPKKQVYTRGSNLPAHIKIDLPKYCYYVPENDKKGEGLCCGRGHPMHTKDWHTTRSRAVSIEEKIKQLQGYLKGEKYEPKRDEIVEREVVDTRESNLPDHIELDLPEFCSYVEASGRSGDGLTCRKDHPKHDKAWTTTRSKKVSIYEKYKQLMAYLEDKVYIPNEDVELEKRPKADHPLDEELPEHCYYAKAANGKGDVYVCGIGHPKHTKAWKTTSSKNVSTREKYKQLIAYLEGRP